MTRIAPRALSDLELLRALLGNRLRVRDGDESLLLRELALFDDAALQACRGLTPAAAYRAGLISEWRRRVTVPPDRPTLKDPECAADFLAPHLTGLEVERLLAVPIDARGRPIGDPMLISVGDVDGTDAAPRAFFRPVLRRGAVAALAAHNHPSGDPSASPADRAATRHLVLAGRVLGVDLSDHLILTDGGCISLRRHHPELWS